MGNGNHFGHILFAVSVISRWKSFALIRSSSFHAVQSLLVTNSKRDYSDAVTVTTSNVRFTPRSPEVLQDEALELYEKLRDCKDGYMSQPLNSALNILSDALRLYGPDNLFASYNGGKDAEVLLQLMRCVYAKYSASKNKIYKPNLIYFAVKDEFEEILIHIEKSEKSYGLNLKRYETGISQVLEYIFVYICYVVCYAQQVHTICIE